MFKRVYEIASPPSRGHPMRGSMAPRLSDDSLQRVVGSARLSARRRDSSNVSRSSSRRSLSAHKTRRDSQEHTKLWNIHERRVREAMPSYSTKVWQLDEQTRQKQLRNIKRKILPPPSVNQSMPNKLPKLRKVNSPGVKNRDSLKEDSIQSSFRNKTQAKRKRNKS